MPGVSARNFGPTPRIHDGLVRRLAELSADGEQPVSIVGWSLGGILARELARRHPESVRSVITLGSPFRLTDRDEPDATRAGRLFRAFQPWHTEFLGQAQRRGVTGPRCRCRPRRSTPGSTVSCLGRPASTFPAHSARTSRCQRAISAWACTPSCSRSCSTGCANPSAHGSRSTPWRRPHDASRDGARHPAGSVVRPSRAPAGEALAQAGRRLSSRRVAKVSPTDAAPSRRLGFHHIGRWCTDPKK